MFGSADEEAKIIKQVVMSFFEGFHPTIVLPQLFFWPLTLNVQVVWLGVVEEVGCNVDRLMLQRSRMYSNPGFVEWSFSVTKV